MAAGFLRRRPLTRITAASTRDELRGQRARPRTAEREASRQRLYEFSRWISSFRRTNSPRPLNPRKRRHAKQRDSRFTSHPEDLFGSNVIGGIEPYFISCPRCPVCFTVVDVRIPFGMFALSTHRDRPPLYCEFYDLRRS